MLIGGRRRRAVLFVCTSLYLQIVLVFYMYHVDEKMMGRAAGKQYPQMLARHYAGRLRLPAATVVLVAQVGAGLLALGPGQGRPRGSAGPGTAPAGSSPSPVLPCRLLAGRGFAGKRP